MPSSSARARTPAEAASAPVRLPVRPSDAAILERILEDRGTGAAWLFDRYAKDVNRLLWRLLGADTKHDDVVQEVFQHILEKVHTVQDPNALKGWIVSVTIYRARYHIRRRRIRRRLWPLFNAEPRPVHQGPADHEGAQLLRRTQELIDRLPVDEQIVFVLRFIEEKPMADVAAACGVSLATAKRRLRAANKRFSRMVARDPDLALRLARGRGFSHEEDKR